MKTLSVIGAGKVGRTLASLLHQENAVSIVDVVARSKESAEAAVAFIGRGNALNDISKLSPADIFMVACPDDQIATLAEALQASGTVKPGNIVFHCSGAKSSESLSVLKQAKRSSSARLASVHPVKSFADPAESVQSFSGTYCGIEGDKGAADVLSELMRTIDGVPFPLEAKSKTLYHAASVIACNYLVSLQEISLQTFAEAGVEQNLALEILEPLVRGTIDNIFSTGTQKALTGPIARGDSETVADQLNAIKSWQPDYGEVYQLLGKVALEISTKENTVNSDAEVSIRQLFDSQNSSLVQPLDDKSD